MVERAPFLDRAYGAYYHRERPAEDEELTRVGPGTPCGEYLRRFWQPIILAGELGELPRRVRILSEDLVAFRDKRGEIGLLELHCPHRGTSLEFGLIGEKGIRCCYHGWVFDVDGTILETLVSVRTVVAPMRIGSEFPVITTPRSAFTGAWRGTALNIWPAPTAVSP